MVASTTSLSLEPLVGSELRFEGQWRMQSSDYVKVIPGSSQLSTSRRTCQLISNGRLQDVMNPS